MNHLWEANVDVKADNKEEENQENKEQVKAEVKNAKHAEEDRY